MTSCHPLAILIRNQREPMTLDELKARTNYEADELELALSALEVSGEIDSKQVNGESIWWASSEEADVNHIPQGDILRTFCDSGPIGFAIVNADEEIVFANARLEATLGISHTDLIGTNLRTQWENDIWRMYHEDGTDMGPSEWPVSRVLETGEPEFGCEHWMEFPDGTERWVRTNVAPLRTADDTSTTHVIVCCEDLTDVKHREDKLTSEDSRYLKLSSEQILRPFLDAADGNPQVDVNEVIQTDVVDEIVQYVTVEGVPVKDAKEIFENEFSGVDNVRLVKNINGKCRFELVTSGPTLSSIFNEYGGKLHSIVDTQDPGEPCIVGELPGDLDHKPVIRDGAELYSDLELESQELAYSPQLLYDIVADDLTDKQFFALQAAYYSGYFESPRETDGNELADRFGISRQAINNRLRKAQETVIHHLFESSGEAGR